MGDFALLDHQGTFHQLSYYGDQHAVVIYTQANGANTVTADLPTLSKLQTQFAEDEVVFFMLNPVVSNNRQSIVDQAKSQGTALPILVDETQLVAENLQLQKVGETLVINPKTMTIAYRGDLQNQVAKTITNLIAGDEFTPVIADIGEGAPIAYQSKSTHAQQQISYTQDIVPILQENCVSCHHEGGIGSWAMTDHNMIRGWSHMMKEVVMTRRMPPGQIDGHLSKDITDVAGLTVAEKQKLIHWIDAGAPFDSAEQDPLVSMTFENPKYTFGEPDMVVKVPAQEIPATGILDYRYIPVELNLDRDVWVRAMEFVPGDRQVLHHVIAYLSSPADKTVRGRETGAARGESVGGFAPGRPGEEFKDDSGRLITKGSNLLLQMHYTTSGRQTVDETEVGIFLHDSPPKYVMSGGVAGQRRFFVPAHTKEHKLRGEQLIEKDAYLYAMQPHMHYRGKYMRYTAEYPDGTSEDLLSVPKYDFNWQFNYELTEPVFLPAGTKLVATGAMDNSARNPGNPDPSKPVHFGLQTKHEMFFGFTTLRYEGETPENLARGEDGQGGKDGQQNTASDEMAGR